MGSSPQVRFCACKSATLALELLVSIGPSPHLWFLNAIERLMDKQTSLYWYQTLPLVLCVQNRVISTWNTCLYVFQLSSVAFAYKTAHFGLELQVSMGPSPYLWFWAHITACLAQESKVYIGSSPHLWFCACKSATLAHEFLVSIRSSPHLWFFTQNSDFWTSIQVSMGTRHNLSFCARKTAWLAPDLPVSMCPNPHLWFLNAKQRILDQNYKSPWVPDLFCGFEHT